MCAWSCEDGLLRCVGTVVCKEVNSVCVCVLFVLCTAQQLFLVLLKSRNMPICDFVKKM